jgi:outer membrane protein W
MFAIEGSIDFHASDYEDGDIEVIQWPVQVSALWFILPKAKITPYVLGGLGWYYTTIDFSGSLDGLSGETDSMFGAHLGIGARLLIGQSMSLSGDLRYIFLEPNEDALEDENFDTLQFTVSLGFGF